MTTRVETDSMGPIEVPADKYYGAQTMRSRMNFRIGNEKMPIEIVHAFGILKKAAALTNHELDNLEKDNEYLQAGGVFPADLIETWIDYKRTNEVAPIQLRPHPYEFELYYDI